MGCFHRWGGVSFSSTSNNELLGGFASMSRFVSNKELVPFSPSNEFAVWASAPLPPQPQLEEIRRCKWTVLSPSVPIRWWWRLPIIQLAFFFLSFFLIFSIRLWWLAMWCFCNPQFRCGFSQPGFGAESFLQLRRLLWYHGCQFPCSGADGPLHGSHHARLWPSGQNQCLSCYHSRPSGKPIVITSLSLSFSLHIFLETKKRRSFQSSV